MQKSLLLIIFLAVFLGALMPSGNRNGDSRAQAAVDKPTGAISIANDPPAEPRETRIQRSSNGHFYVHAEVNGQLVHFLVDTGATNVALTEEDAQRVGFNLSPADYQVVGMGAGGPVQGQQIDIDRVELDGKRVDGIRGSVIEGLDISLLGQGYLSRISEVSMSGDYMVLR